MSLPSAFAKWNADLDAVHVLSDELRDDLQAVKIEGTRGKWRVTRTFEFEPESGSLHCMREESDEPQLQPDGEETTDYVDAGAYFDKLFTNARPLGEIDLPSGYIAVVSPQVLDNKSEPFYALARQVPPGRYPLEAAESEEEGLIAYRCVFSSARAVSFRKATAELPGSSVACMLWFDATQLDAAEKCSDALSHAETGVEVLENGLAVGVTDTGADGGYPLLWGFAENGEIACLILDVWFDAPTERFEVEFVVGEPVPPQLVAVGVSADKNGAQVVLITPDSVMAFALPPEGATNYVRQGSRSICGNVTRESFQPGERVRCIWRGRKLA